MSYFTEEMRVTKRNGKTENVSFDKILSRIKKIGNEVGIQLNYSSLTIKVIDQLYDKIETSKIDELAAEQCASLSTQHYDYSTLASRICVSNHQKNTPFSMFQCVKKLVSYKDFEGNPAPLISNNVMDFVKMYKSEIEEIIDYNRDYLIDYFGFKTLERAYLFRINGTIVERIQHMWMRVAIGIHCNTQNQNNFELVKETYNLMSQKYFTHATPTLFNAGTLRPQLSSCYLIAMEEDSINGIYGTLGDCAKISKWAGGIGLHIHNIRAKGTRIIGTNGTSNGIVPMLRVFNNTARYVDQGGGRRNGSFAIYLEPWHADIEDFLEMKKNHGDEELKARDLFYALWMSDLFMERIKSDSDWSLFCPNEAKGLSDVYGDEFKTLFEKFESSGFARKTMKARQLWFKILDAQMETGTPYLLYKDAANKKSNQKNLGTIKSSNLCCEIMEFSNENETAVCNLASIALPMFVNEETKEFDYNKLHEVSKVVCNNLNRVIDVNFYPTEKTQNSNFKHRPIGIGVQGLADTFILMDVAFTSDEAKEINKKIFETMYHGAMEKSYENSREIYENSIAISELNKLDFSMGAYSSFKDSPLSQGVFQFDMWNVTPSDRYDWNSLREKIMKYGVINSLLIAPMPTASTSQILGFNECFEPFTSNLYSRRTLAGEFIVINKYLIKELIQLGHWNENIKNSIISNKGSVQQLDFLSSHLKEKYKIVWEIPMKHVIDMSADRGAYICQSQSLNLWQEDPTYSSLTNMHFYAWKKGLKTGMYYLRRKGKHQAQQFTIEPEKKTNSMNNDNDNDDDVCEMCSA
jgi:ribonucleoside-diphosphate reductase alpha chain|uniref:ribonucleoside-diphosphate reductase n=1 Tax=viral metagenome TaxID=1070528 RepID=A0A6C0IQM4_9ZZZZ